MYWYSCVQPTYRYPKKGTTLRKAVATPGCHLRRDARMPDSTDLQHHTLLTLLKEAGLETYFGTLNATTTLLELHERLVSNRPKFLAFVKECGLERLAERQVLANAIIKAEKAGRLAPPNPIPHLRPVIF